MRRMYSLAQIQAIVALMAKEGELDFSDVDLEVKSLIENPTPVDFHIEDMTGVPANCVLKDIFSKCKVYGNFLDITFNFKITNNGESATSATQIQYNFVIPEEAAKLIKDCNGKTVNEGVASMSPITAFDYYLTTNAYPTIFGTRALVEITNNPAVNTMGIYFISLPSIDAGKTIIATGRISLMLR